jgi:hypothetical protein
MEGRSFMQLITPLILFGCAVCTAAPAMTVASRTACIMEVGEPYRVRLDSIYRVLMNATSMAANGEDLLVVGTPFYAFPNNPNSLIRLGIGFVRSSDGGHSMVENPVPHFQLRDVQAVAARQGGWHVVFAIGSRSVLTYDSAHIWYGHYDGASWTRVERIASVRQGNLIPRFAANLIETGGSIAFAYAFDLSFERNSNERGNQGAVMVLERDGAWVQDTLHTWERPRSIQLGTARDGHLIAYIAQGYFADRRSRGPSLFLAEYDGAWSEPRLVLEAEPYHVMRLLKPTGGEATPWLAFHRAMPGLDVESTLLTWASIAEDGAVQWQPVGEVLRLGEPAVAQARAGTVMLVRDGDSQERLRVYLGRPDGVHALGTFAAPLVAFNTFAAATADDRIFVFTGGPDPDTTATPNLTSFLTQIGVRCPLDPG